MALSFRLRVFTPADLPGIIDAQNRSLPLHPWSLAELERDLERLEPDLQHHFLVAETADGIAGMADYQRPAGTFHPRRFQLQLCVQPEWRGQGVGKALHEAALQDLAALDPLSLSVQVRESDPWALRFVRDRGYLEVKRDFESFLDLAALDFGPLAECEEYLFAQGIRLADLRELDSPEFRQNFHRVFETVRVDVPRADPPTPLSFAFFEENVLDEPDLVPESFVFALEGTEILGFTGGYRGVGEGTLDTWLTGVVRPARGRGLATALKMHSLRGARAAGFSVVRTDNDTRNMPMLQVNEKLGFLRQPAWIYLRKTFGA